MRLRYRIHANGEPPRIRRAEANCIRIGRDPSCEIALDATRHAMVSGRHARVEAVADGFRLVHDSPTNKTLLNGQPVPGATPLRPGDQVQLGATGPTIEFLDLDAVDSPAPTDLTEHADEVAKALLRASASVDRFDTTAGGVMGRTRATADFVLDHPHVSNRHARITRTDDGRTTLTDLGSANGTYVNGRRIAQTVVVAPGDRIDIGPYQLRFDGRTLVGESRAENVELSAVGVSRVVADRATGRSLTILVGVDLVVRPREFVCLLGPSGSGKSTLLAILAGRRSPDSGRVLLNGEDLYANFEAVKQDIAVVPQKDVLHDALSVGRALQYTAELRLPPDTTGAEVESSIADMLGIVGLTERRETLIRHLSGGQVKRASLANEMISRPGLLFLDEVTSGLDEQTDREVMELFRRVTDGGKTVICITHSLANVETTCHLVVILTAGGRLAFVGTPEEAKAYFGIARLGDVYQTLVARTSDQWAASFRTSHYYARYVAQRMVVRDAPHALASPRPSPTGPRGVGGIRQAWILGRRYVSIWRGNWIALLVLLGQATLVSALLALVFGDVDAIAAPADRLARIANLIMLAAVSCFWFGCNTAAKELVKERVIYRRERAIHLSVWGYFAAKFAVLAVIGAAQSTILFAVLRGWCHLPGSMAVQWLILIGLATAGTILGLLISAIARTEEVGTALVPIVIIPQIILAGVVAPLSGFARVLAEFGITVYWGRIALERLLPEADQRLLGGNPGGWVGPLSLVVLQGVIFTVICVTALKSEAGQE